MSTFGPIVMKTTTVATGALALTAANSPGGRTQQQIDTKDSLSPSSTSQLLQQEMPRSTRGSTRAAGGQRTDKMVTTSSTSDSTTQQPLQLPVAESSSTSETIVLTMSPPRNAAAESTVYVMSSSLSTSSSATEGGDDIGVSLATKMAIDAIVNQDTADDGDDLGQPLMIVVSSQSD